MGNEVQVAGILISIAVGAAPWLVLLSAKDWQDLKDWEKVKSSPLYLVLIAWSLLAWEVGFIGVIVRGAPPEFGYWHWMVPWVKFLTWAWLTFAGVRLVILKWKGYGTRWMRKLSAPVRVFLVFLPVAAAAFVLVVGVLPWQLNGWTYKTGIDPHTLPDDGLVRDLVFGNPYVARFGYWLLGFALNAVLLILWAWKFREVVPRWIVLAITGGYYVTASLILGLQAADIIAGWARYGLGMIDRLPDIGEIDLSSIGRLAETLGAYDWSNWTWPEFWTPSDIPTLAPWQPLPTQSDPSQIPGGWPPSWWPWR